MGSKGMQREQGREYDWQSESVKTKPLDQLKLSEGSVTTQPEFHV